MADQSLIFAKATSNKPGALKHPTARAFAPEEWVDALSALDEQSERDITLTHSAIWFGQQIKMLRQHTDRILASLSRKDAVFLAVAQLNREYETLQQRMARARHEERKNEFVDLHVASQRLIRTGQPGNALPADDLNDALVDTLPVWLYQAFECSASEHSKAYDLTQLGVNALRAFTLELTLTKLWQQCLWLDWRLGKDGERLSLAPNDRAAETLRHAWLFRQQGIATQYSFVDLAAESAAKKANVKTGRLKNNTIIAQESRPGRRKDFITGRATNRSASYLQSHI